jgi:succinyl-diaminopimelate desuccinylase
VTDLFQLTADLVAIPSESYAEQPLVEHLESALGSIAHVEVTRVGDNLVARTDLGRSQRVVFAGHTDTVPANNNAEPRVDGDTLWGLGSADMKGGLAIMLASAAIHDTPVHDVTYVFYAREEVAAADSGLGELFEQRPDLLQGDLAILGEPTDATIEAGCQGTLRMRVDLAGARAHTARPWMGRNAIHRLGPILTALDAYEAREPEIDGCRYREAVQAVFVDGGVAGNVVPDAASVTVGHRFAPDRTPEEAQAFVESLLAPHLGEGDEVTLVEVSPAAAPALTHPILASLIARHDLEVRAKLGWTDVSRFAAAGVPAMNLGPGDAQLAHSADERVERASIERVWTLIDDLLSVQI